MKPLEGYARGRGWAVPECSLLEWGPRQARWCACVFVLNAGGDGNVAGFISSQARGHPRLRPCVRCCAGRAFVVVVSGGTKCAGSDYP